MAMTARAGCVVIAAVVRALAAAPSAPTVDNASFLSATREVLQHDHVDIRDGAWILEASGLDVAAVVRNLTAVLQDPAPGLAAEAAQFLGFIGPRASAAVPALMNCVLDGGSVDARYACVVALGRIGPAAGAALSPLLAALKDEDPFVRHAAAAALGRIAPQAALARRALQEALNDRDPGVRRAAARALTRP